MSSFKNDAEIEMKSMQSSVESKHEENSATQGTAAGVKPKPRVHFDNVPSIRQIPSRRELLDAEMENTYRKIKAEEARREREESFVEISLGDPEHEVHDLDLSYEEPRGPTVLARIGRYLKGHACEILICGILIFMMLYIYFKHDYNKN